MIQTTRLVYLAIVHRPHRPNYGTEPSKLHGGREVDRPVWALFVSNSHLFVLSKLFEHPINEGFLSIYARERGVAVDATIASSKSCITPSRLYR